MRSALMDVPGVRSADVDCTAGNAVCEVESGTDPALLVEAVVAAGYDTSLVEDEAEEAGKQ